MFFCINITAFYQLIMGSFSDFDRARVSTGLGVLWILVVLPLCNSFDDLSADFFNRSNLHPDLQTMWFMKSFGKCWSRVP